MKLKIDHFCNLATSPAWQAWLYRFNADLYRYLSSELKNSSGCNGNVKVMMAVLKKIENIDGGPEALHNFLVEKFPNTIIVQEQKKEVDEFAVFRSEILTYPHRTVINGTPSDLKRQVELFCADKSDCEFLIRDGVAYVEYLRNDEVSMKDKVPLKNWVLRNRKTNG